MSTTGKDYGLPEGYEDWAEAEPPLGTCWISVEVRGGGIGSGTRVISRRYFVPPKPEPTVPDVGIGAVVRFTSRSSGDTYRVMKGDEGWWFDQRDSDWSDSDLLATVNDDGFTVELDGL